MGIRPAIVVSSVLAVAATAIGGHVSQAAGGQGAWAQWSPLSETENSAVGAFTIGADGFSAPTGEFETDAQGPSRSASDFLNAKTPPGERFGSSQGENRLRLNLKDTNTDEPSTTVFRFPSGTPAGHFAFVLGDIDVDEVEISGTASDGSALTAADLGFRSTFNFCNGHEPFPTTCEDKTWTTEPEWRPAQMTLRGSTPGNETEGASGWFTPTVSLKTLKFVFSKLPKGGSPTYRVWFVGDDAATPTPTPTPTPPTPTPTPTPTPVNRPEVPLKVVTSDTTIPATGATKVIKSIKTPGRITERTVCTAAKASAAGQVRLCAHRFNRAKGQVTVRAFGRPVNVKVTIRSTPIGADRKVYRAHRKVFLFQAR